MRKTFTLIAVLALALGWAVPPAGAQLSGPSPLTFHEVTPCAVFDTRPSQGGTGIMASNEVRTFHVVGSTSDFAGQGGVAGGCGIPGFAGGAPQVEMVYLNLVAVDPVNAGNLKIWATDDAEPNGGVVNYQKLTPNLNNSNSIIVGVRQDVEGSDVSVRSNVGSVHVRGVTLGYLIKGAFSFWSLGGNAGTTPSTAFLGTTDNKPLNFRVNNARAFRLEPGMVPNVVGGWSSNATGVGVIGATVGGGGCPAALCTIDEPNQVTADLGTVAGGAGNASDDTGATVGGGLANVAGGLAATVPGGESNDALGGWSFAAGRRAKALHQGSFVWADSDGVDFGSTGIDEFSVRAGGGVRFAVGANTCTLDPGTGAWTGSCAPSAVPDAWLLGGNAGTDPATEFVGTTDDVALNFRVNGERAFRLEPGGNGTSPNVIGGASINSVGAGTIDGATIAGGGCPASLCGTDDRNQVTDDFGTVGGGRNNTAASEATVAGGVSNSASQSEATVGGGGFNEAASISATVGGGALNEASGFGSTVAGGSTNTASGSGATVGGGNGNDATGLRATVPGGSGNVAAGDFSFAAGHLAEANHQGTFVWADSQLFPMESTANDQFIVRAQGNIFFQEDDSLDDQGGFINTSTGAFLSSTGVWTDVSSAEVKEGFAPVEPEAILEGVASLPVTTWSYVGQDGVRHIGPVAEDFHATFGVGESPRHLASLDTGGVALAAIQGLHTENTELEDRVAELEAGRATRGGGPTVPSPVWWGIAAALGLLGLGLGRRWERRIAAAA